MREALARNKENGRDIRGEQKFWILKGYERDKNENIKIYVQIQFF
jgi:hypothetical protein